MGVERGGCLGHYDRFMIKRKSWQCAQTAHILDYYLKSFGGVVSGPRFSFPSGRLDGWTRVLVVLDLLVSSRFPFAVSPSLSVPLAEPGEQMDGL